MYYKRIRDLREDHDLTQAQLAQILKITRQQYGLYESGKRTIPIDLLVIIADYYNVSIDYIVSRSNSKKVAKKINNQE